MSHIINQKEKLIIVHDILKEFQRNDINQDNLEYALENLIPKKIQYKIKNTGLIAFYPRYESVEINIEKASEIAESYAKDLKEKNTNLRTLKSYCTIFILAHEIEHSYQYLIANNIEKKDEELVKRTYKELFKLLKQKKNKNPIKTFRQYLSYFLYIKNQNLLILERNANLEAIDLIEQNAINDQDEEIYKIFNKLKRKIIKCGYTNNSNGCIEETFKKILLPDTYKKIYIPNTLDEKSRAWYGLNIDDETKEKVLKYKL